MNSRAISAQARAELLLQMRRGENAIVTLAVPIGVLVFFAKVDAVTTDFSDPLDFLVPGVLALSVMASAMVSLGIATGFERPSRTPLFTEDSTGRRREPRRRDVTMDDRQRQSLEISDDDIDVPEFLKD